MSRRLLLLVSLLLLTCKPQESEAPIPVILISIDTLRSDHLPMYGFRGVETPALDEFRRDGILFEHTWSHSPLTLPSHTTILSGLLPAGHGVRDNTGFHVDPATKTLATILHDRGYATGGAVSAYILRAGTGISHGFDFYNDDVERGNEEKSLGAVQRPGAETTAVAEKWIAAQTQIQRQSKRPFFFFLHLYEPHAPYNPPEPYWSRYPNHYDGEIAQVDAIVGGFLQFLKQQGIYQRALIVLLSDHGEGLGDHGELEHGIFLYRESIAVPMVIKLPENRLAGESDSEAAGLDDVAPTILNVLGLTIPKMDGRPLLTSSGIAAVGSRPIYSETYYPRFHFGWSDLHSLIEGNDHLIQAPRPELFDLAADPHEKQNVMLQQRRRYVALSDQIVPFEHPPTAPSAVSEEETAKLAALGYIGSASVPATGPLPDPKDKIETFHALQEAFRLYQGHDDAKALAAFDALLKDNANMIDLWDVRSKVLFRLGRSREAIDSEKEALRRSPSSLYLAVDIANELLLTGAVDEAEKHAELALPAEPAKAHELLARIAMIRGDLGKAEREAQAAVKSQGDTNPALYTLARIAQKKGDFAAVVSLTDDLLARQAKTHAPALTGVRSLRADALARLGRNAEAEVAFRDEINLFPDDSEAYRGLIVLLVSEGRTDEGTRAVLQLAAASPTPRTYRSIAETLDVVGDHDGARYWRARAGGERLRN